MVVPSPADEYEAQWWGPAPQEQIFILVPADQYQCGYMPWAQQNWPMTSPGAWPTDSMGAPCQPQMPQMPQMSQVQPKVEPSQAAPAPALPALPALPVPAVQPKAVNGTKTSWSDEPIGGEADLEAQEAVDDSVAQVIKDTESTLTPRRPTSSAARRLRRKRASERQRQAEADPNAYPAELDMDQLRKRLETDPNGVAGQMRGHVYDLARDPSHCRLLQEVLERCSSREGQRLAEQLQGRVWELSTCPHGNFVVQKVISHLSVSASEFIAHELQGWAVPAAKNRQACRILCRLLEFRGSGATWDLIDELLEDAGSLCQHSFAHHVIQSVLEHGKGEHKGRIAAALLSDGFRFATHKHSSYLIEKVLCYCSERDQQELIRSLGTPPKLLELAKTPYGSFVARALLRDDRVNYEGAMRLFKQHQKELEESKHGLRLLSELGLLV